MKKIIIIMSIILFVLLVIIELIVQSDAFALRIRPYVAGPLKAALGEGAEIGKVRANFIPLYLEVRDISISGPQGAQLAAFRKIKVYLNPLPLLQKKIRLSSISILEPRIYAARAKDGEINLEPLLERIRSNIARTRLEGQTRFSFLLRSITIRNGQVAFTDDITSAKVLITGINMSARVDLSQERVRAVIKTAQVSASAPSFPELASSLKASLEYDKGKLRIQSTELSIADASFMVSGDVGPLPDAVLDLKVSVKSGPKALHPFTAFLNIPNKQEALRFEATALIRGKLSDPVIDGSMKLSALSIREMVLQNAALSFSYKNSMATLKGEKWKIAENNNNVVIDSIDAALGYSKGGLDIRRFVVISEDLALRLEGRADSEAGFDAYFSAESSGSGKTLSFLTSLPLEGAAGVRGKLSGVLTSPRFNGTLVAGPITVRGILFNDVRGGLEYENKKITVSKVDIQEQSSRYIFDGAVDFKDKEPAYVARLRVLHSDVVNIVALFYERLPLRLSAEGELSFEGTAKNYAGSGFLKLAPGSAYGESFIRGAITAKLTTGRIAFPQVILYKEKGMVKATGWIGFDGTYSAELESRDVDLSAVDHLAGMPLGGSFKLLIHSSGSFSAPFVKASLEIDELLYRQAPLGGMNAGAEIKDGLFTVTAGLSEDRVNLLLKGKLNKPYLWTAEARVRADAIEPGLIVGNKASSTGMKMIANGIMTLQGGGLDISTIVGRVDFKRLSLVIGDLRLDNESDATFSIDGGKVVVTSLNFIGPDTRVSISGGAMSMTEVEMALKGTANLSFLKLLSREVEHAGGAAEIKLTIKDNLKKPDVAGELRILNGDIKLKDIPQRFDSLNGRIMFSQGRFVADSLSGEMGGGTLNVSGWAQLDGFSLQNFSAKAAVDNVTVRYPEGLVSTLSGDLYYDGDASEQSLSGDITIKRALYDKRIEWKTMLVDIGRGLYQKKKTEVEWIGDTQINVRFHGTNGILFKNNLAAIPLEVDLFLRGTVNHPQLLGRLEARKGIVYFRKNEFKILNASADFMDPGRMNPVLDIQAETRVREYEIRLSVTGTAERAVVTLISEPSLIDTDILSLLALGKRGSELKGKETGVGVGEAASFATGQFQDVFERRARSLTGLDRVQIDPYVNESDMSVPRVTVSKELVHNKVYATYSQNVGASAPEQLFRLEYLLDRHFSLVGERDETGNNGADIKFRFEFN